MDFQPHRVNWTDEKVSRFWDFLAINHGTEFFSEKHAPDLAARLIRHRPKTAVDIGCGTGTLINELARHGVQSIGIDSSPALLEEAQRRTPTATFHLGSVTSIPLDDASVDSALLIEVVEHLDDETLEA